MNAPRLNLKSQLSVILMVASHLLLAGCSGLEVLDRNGQSLVDVPGIYTLTNLRPDSPKPFLYSINYLRPGLIPICTPVKLTDASQGTTTITDLNSGREYTFIQHGRTPEPMAVILRQYFGRDCEKNKQQALSAIDQRGIKLGKALPGMTKQGVIYAIGYPPSHRTPTLEGDQWVYWRSKVVTDRVVFADGIVVDGTR